MQHRLLSVPAYLQQVSELVETRSSLYNACKTQGIDTPSELTTDDLKTAVYSTGNEQLKDLFKQYREETEAFTQCLKDRKREVVTALREAAGATSRGSGNDASV